MIIMHYEFVLYTDRIMYSLLECHMLQNCC